jgi:hypothetical protein
MPEQPLIDNTQELATRTKQVAWEQKSQEVDLIQDRLGKGVDEGIKETVVAFQVLGINTIQSCEGHMEWGEGTPWVDVEAPDTRELRQQMHQAFDTAENANGQEHITYEELDKLFDHAHELRREIKRRNVQEAAKVMGYLAEFYNNRDVPLDRRLILNTSALSGSTRIESQGGVFQETASAEIKQQKLAEYQEEMRAFTEFLKEKHFSS